MLTWSSSNNLAFNATKTKAMLFTISQIENVPGFEQEPVEFKYKDKILENVSEFRLLGITIDKNLNWKKRINNTTKPCYATLCVLRKNQRYTPLPTRKQQAEFSYFIKFRLLQRIIIWHSKIHKTTTSESTKCISWFQCHQYKIVSDRRTNIIFSGSNAIQNN